MELTVVDDGTPQVRVHASGCRDAVRESRTAIDSWTIDVADRAGADLEICGDQVDVDAEPGTLEYAAAVREYAQTYLVYLPCCFTE